MAFSGLVSTWRPYAYHYVIQKHVKLIEPLKKQMSDGNSTCPLDPIDKKNYNGHFQVQWIQWTLSFGYLTPYACHYVIQIHVN
jgi:hypothetical protein